MFPERFGGIAFRRALGQYRRVPPAAMLPEPIGHWRVTVVGGAIVDVVQRMRVAGTSYLFEKPQVSFRVEDRLVVKQETCRIASTQPKTFTLLRSRCWAHGAGTHSEPKSGAAS